jgi:hypothetical protein
MRVASRYMPSYEETISKTFQFIFYFILAIFISGLGYAIWDEPWLGFFLLLVVFAVYILSVISPNIMEELNIEKLAKERKGENIGTFAKSLDYRNIDTWIIRAVYEEIQSELGFKEIDIPIRTSDNLENDLQLDDEDLFYIYSRVAIRAGISDKDGNKNPYYDKVETVEDMILFLNTQPKECRRCEHVTRLNTL